MTPERFRSVLLELLDENPFAVRAVLRLLEVSFTTEVPTMAVTAGPRPRLLVNLDFVAAHCHGDVEVKAVLCHEYLHVLLRHTSAPGPLTPARHLALDAVINAIIHRQLGPAYSAMMARYYAEDPFPTRLLRPPTPLERYAYCRTGPARPDAQLGGAWMKLYEGKLVADDLEDLARDLQVAESLLGRLLGTHGSGDRPLDGLVGGALDAALSQFNGSGIWRAPRGRGSAAAAYDALVNAKDARLGTWRQTALAVFRRHLQPDPHSRPNEERPVGYRLPVLTPGDRRAFLRSTWSPFLPEASWLGAVPARSGTAQVYLDVSGSMEAEMPLLVALLAQLSPHVRRPFWAFSDHVAPAVIEGGRLKTRTTGGTSMACVLEHVAKTRPRAAVVVTDGYIERVDPALVAAAADTRLHAVVSRDGSSAELERARIPYTQLGWLAS